MVSEVCRIFCATANPTEVVIAETGLGRAMVGVVDGAEPKGIEDDANVAWRKGFLRQICYKLLNRTTLMPRANPALTVFSTQ